MVMRRLLRIVLLLALSTGVVYGVKNYREIGKKDKILGEWAKSSEELVNPVLEKVDEGIEYLSGPRVEVPEAGSSGNSKEVVANDTKEMVDQFIETIKELPEKQMVKVKEQIIQEIFPDCQCSCSIDEGDND